MTTPEAGAANEAATAEAPLPAQISEIHRYKLLLLKETQGRLQAEAINLQMAQKGLSVAMQKAQADHTLLMDELKATYKLAEGDNITTAGGIERMPKKEPERQLPPPPKADAQPPPPAAA